MSVDERTGNSVHRCAKDLDIINGVSYRFIRLGLAVKLTVFPERNRLAGTAEVVGQPTPAANVSRTGALSSRVFIFGIQISAHF